MGRGRYRPFATTIAQPQIERAIQKHPQNRPARSIQFASARQRWPRIMAAQAVITAGGIHASKVDQASSGLAQDAFLGDLHRPNDPTTSGQGRCRNRASNRTRLS